MLYYVTVYISHKFWERDNKDELIDEAYEFFDGEDYDHPMSKRRDWSVICMSLKGSDMSLLHHKVTLNELNGFVEFLDKMPDSRLKENVYFRVQPMVVEESNGNPVVDSLIRSSVLPLPTKHPNDSESSDSESSDSESESMYDDLGMLPTIKDYENLLSRI